MLHTYRDPITGKIYQAYDDEPPDDEPEDEEDKEPEDWDFDTYWFNKEEKERERYYNWLFGRE